MQDLVSQFKLARDVGTPLIAIKTPDPAATIKAISKKAGKIAADKKGLRDVPMIEWNIIHGWTHINKAGEAVIEDICGEGVRDKTANPINQIVLAQQLPEPSVLFMMNAHRFSNDNVQFIQGLWNLRDQFASNLRTAVLLGPDFKFPPEIAQDILTLDEPLPNDEQLEKIVNKTLENAGITGQDTGPAVDALRGLAAFPAAQSTAMSIVLGKGLDVYALWERKRQLIDETAGLSVWRGKESFHDLGGLYQAKEYFRRVMNGKDPFRVVVYIDEGEKVFAGSSGPVTDSSGVSSGFLATMLSYQQDTGADGVMFVGPPGAAKSAFAKAIANEAGVPCITLDLNGMKHSLVGESEGRLRNALKIITAVGGGRALFVMTCNRMVNLPPELRRRYSDIFYFDLPDEEEREVIFDIYAAKYHIQRDLLDPLISRPWTGDEIRRCCMKAYRLDISPEEASAYIVPVSKSAADEIKSLREQAHQRFLSASYAGVYRNETNKVSDSRRFANNDLN